MEGSKDMTTYDFITNYLSESVPIAIRHLSSQWDASKKWTDEYLNSEVGDQLIQITKYEHRQLDHLKKFQTTSNITLNKFLNELYNKSDPQYDYFWDDIIPDKLNKDIQMPTFISFLDLKYTKIWKVYL